QGIRLPGLIHGSSTEMIRTAFFKARYPRNLTTHVEAILEEKPRGAAVDHLRTVRRELLRGGHFLKRRNLATRQLCAALQEHPRVDVARHPVASVVPCDVVERVQKRTHMIPVAMRDSDGLHVHQRHPKVLAVSEKECPLWPGIEQQLVMTL